MVVSEAIAAIVISVLGLRRSYRYALRGENRVRGVFGQHKDFPENSKTYSRAFIRRVFKVGLGLTLRIEKFRGRLSPSRASTKQGKEPSGSPSSSLDPTKSKKSDR